MKSICPYMKVLNLGIVQLASSLKKAKDKMCQPQSIFHPVQESSELAKELESHHLKLRKTTYFFRFVFKCCEEG